MSKKEELKRQILQLTREYYNEVHKTSKVFEPGKSFVNYGGRYFNDEEMVNLVDSSLDSGSLPVLGPISLKPVWQNGWG